MPKHEIRHKAGQPLSKDEKTIIDKFFGEKESERLQRFGGRIMISVAAPYKEKKEKVDINDDFIKNLRKISADSNKVKKMIDNLPIKSLKEICFILDQPVKKTAKTQEIIDVIINNIQAADYWNNISKS